MNDKMINTQFFLEVNFFNKCINDNEANQEIINKTNQSLIHFNSTVK